MNNRKLCICIPTYNRSDTIEKKLQDEISFLQKNKIDVIIYDSSINADTEKIVQRYISKGFHNLIYKKSDSSIPSNIKVYNIFKDVSESSYDYIWMIHDHTVCTEKAIDGIFEGLKLNYDFYVLNMQANSYSIDVFGNLEQFLYESAWRLNSFGASILNVKTFLKNTDWDRISKKYNRKETLNYSHIGFYFERATEVENFKVCRINFDRKDFWDFKRTEKTSWNENTIRICTECWGNVIMNLPSSYTNKVETLRTQDKWFMAKYSLITYKKQRAYGVKHFWKYKKWIKLICPEDYVRDFMIAIMPLFMCKIFFLRNLINRIKTNRKKGSKIYIYGAGRHATECARILTESGICFDGFIVTSLDGNPEELENHLVYEASGCLKRENALIIIAVLTSGVDEVKKNIERIKGENIVIDCISFDI